jgi:hypothetical protein
MGRQEQRSRRRGRAVVQRPQRCGAAVQRRHRGSAGVDRGHVVRSGSAESAESAAVRSRGEESETVIGALGNATLGNTRLVNDRTRVAKAQPRGDWHITSDDAPVAGGDGEKMMIQVQRRGARWETSGMFVFRSITPCVRLGCPSKPSFLTVISLSLANGMGKRVSHFHSVA